MDGNFSKLRKKKIFRAYQTRKGLDIAIMSQIHFEKCFNLVLHEIHISGNGYVNIKFSNEPMPYINKKEKERTKNRYKCIWLFYV